jgi:hypothetical protein
MTGFKVERPFGPGGDDPPPGSADDYEAMNGDGEREHGANGHASNGAAHDEPPKGKATWSAAIKATPYPWTDPTTIKPRQWLYGRHYIRKFVTATIAPSGVGKSSLSLVEAVSMAIGRDLLTDTPLQPRRVWYWNGEDPKEELIRRVQAICLHYGLTEADLGGRLFLDSGRTRPIKVARDDRRSGIVVDQPAVDSLIATMLENRIDVLIMDPFISTHAVSENDNGAIDMVVKALAGVAEDANCGVDVVHHARKTNGAEVTVEDARGAVALMAAVRSGRTLNSMTQKEAEEAGIEANRRRLYFRVENGKGSMVPPASQADWRRLASVGLGNGDDTYAEDQVGVVAAWSWPDAFANITVDDTKAVQQRVSEDQWRADVQAASWVGKAVAEVLGLDLEDAADKSKAKSMVKKWVTNGVLVVVKRLDEKRRPKRFVEVGKCL